MPQGGKISAESTLKGECRKGTPLFFQSGRHGMESGGKTGSIPDMLNV